MWQAFLIVIWQLSAILLLTSSPLKLCQVGWGQTHIFRFLQICLIGVKPRMGLGHSRTFTDLSISHSCCVLRVIVLLKGKPSAQSEVLNALDWVLYILISIFWSFPSALTFYSVPAAEKQLHSMRLLLAHFTFGMVLCRWWAVPALLQTWCLELRFIRPENLVSHSEVPLGAFFFFANSKCVFMWWAPSAGQQHSHQPKSWCCWILLNPSNVTHP